MQNGMEFVDQRVSVTLRNTCLRFIQPNEEDKIILIDMHCFNIRKKMIVPCATHFKVAAQPLVDDFVNLSSTHLDWLAGYKYTTN